MADPLATTRHVLAVLRDAGVDFPTAWAIAVPASRPHRERVALRAALDETEDAWRRAFVGAPPTAGERAASRIAALWNEREDDAEPVGDLVASRCG